MILSITACHIPSMFSENWTNLTKCFSSIYKKGRLGFTQVQAQPDCIIQPCKSQCVFRVSVFACTFEGSVSLNLVMATCDLASQLEKGLPSPATTSQTLINESPTKSNNDAIVPAQRRYERRCELARIIGGCLLRLTYILGAVLGRFLNWPVRGWRGSREPHLVTHGRMAKTVVHKREFAPDKSSNSP